MPSADGYPVHGDGTADCDRDGLGHPYSLGKLNADRDAHSNDAHSNAHRFTERDKYGLAHRHADADGANGHRALP